MEGGNGAGALLEMLGSARSRGASDLYLAAGSRPLIRVEGALSPLSEEMLPPGAIEGAIGALFPEREAKRLRERGSARFSCPMPGEGEEFKGEGPEEAGAKWRLRVGALKTRTGCALSLRLLPQDVPAPSALGVPDAVMALAGHMRGLLLVAGTAGSGMTTTIASLVRMIATGGERVVATVEDPVEYVFPGGRGMVMQQEVGIDCPSAAAGIETALRQSADILAVGEIRGRAAAERVLAAAELGRLVIAGIPAGGTVAAIRRFAEFFPEERQKGIRGRFASAFCGILSQQLLPRQDGGQVAAFEVMLANQSMRTLIQEEKNYQLGSMLSRSRSMGMQAMDDAIYDLYMQSAVSSDTAIAYAQDPVGMQQKVRLF